MCLHITLVKLGFHLTNIQFLNVTIKLVIIVKHSAVQASARC